MMVTYTILVVVEYCPCRAVDLIALRPSQVLLYSVCGNDMCSNLNIGKAMMVAGVVKLVSFTKDINIESAVG